MALGSTHVGPFSVFGMYAMPTACQAGFWESKDKPDLGLAGEARVQERL